jgi:hypothetical protein
MVRNMAARRSDERGHRLLVRQTPMMTLRVECSPGRKGGSGAPTSATVEWAGRIGHPSSYGLLGGRLAASAGVEVQSSGAKYKDALASRSDDVRWGLPAEYDAAVQSMLEVRPQPVRVSTAAHGAIGSSEYVFQRVALLLCRVLAGGLPTEDSEVWRLLDQCWNEA